MAESKLITEPSRLELLDNLSLSGERFAECYRVRVGADDIIVIRHPAGMCPTEIEGLRLFATEVRRLLDRHILLIPENFKLESVNRHVLESIIRV